MRVTYDPAADALYVYVCDAEVAETREVAPDFNLDLSAEGDVVGIEILGASQRPGSNPMAIAFEILGRDLAA
jgi:uncharacterized protein YuzE